MTDYEMNWQADAYREKYELLNAKVKYFEEYLKSPVLQSFFIVNQTVTLKFDQVFNE